MLARYSDVYSGFVNSFDVIEALLVDEVVACEAVAPE